MKAFIKILFSSLILVGTACSQDLSDKINGTWKYIDDMDCPDFLLFKSDGSYTILNDCGSQDPKEPIVEKGRWCFDIKEKTIKLTNREFISINSVFSEYHGKGESLLFKVKKISDKNLILCFVKNNNDCITENYIRIE